MSLSLGSPAPAIDLATDDGRFSLAEHAGKTVVVYFYPKDDTSGCTIEAKDFTAFAPEFERLGVVVVGISPDGENSHAKFRAKHGLAVVLASDPNQTAANAYGVWKEKSMYGRKYMGIERTTVLIGPDGRIARIWEKVKVTGHAEAVLKAIGG